MVIDDRSVNWILACDTCGTQFTRKRGQAKNKTTHFCSRSCINKGRQHTDEWKSALSLRNSGANNPFAGKRHTEEAKKRAGDKISLSYANASEDEKSRRKSLQSLASSGTGNHFYGRRHDAASRSRMSSARAAGISEGRIRCGPRGRKGAYTSSKTGLEEHYDSFFELLRMRMLDDDDTVTSWTKRHGITIPYEFEAARRTYVPDFLVSRNDVVSLEEIKGYEDPMRLSAKLTALHEFCQQRGYTYVFFEPKEFEQLVREKYGCSIAMLRSKE